jgi:hypothetical protein
MKRVLLAAAALAALPLAADPPKGDGRVILGTDQVTVYWCPCSKMHWTQVADSARECPLKGCEEHPKCGDFAGDYKIVLRTGKDGAKAGQEIQFDVETFEIVVDKDQKPDEKRVMDVASVKGKFVAGKEDDKGEFERGEEGELLTATVAGKDKIASLRTTLAKKGEYLLILEIVRGDKAKTKVESEIRLTVE